MARAHYIVPYLPTNTRIYKNCSRAKTAPLQKLHHLHNIIIVPAWRSLPSTSLAAVLHPGDRTSDVVVGECVPHSTPLTH
jgi:hypothetical protein